MNTKFLLVCLCLSIVFVSCKKDEEPAPIAAYSFSVSGQFAPLPVTFNNTSQNSVTWLWSFGDGATSTEQNPTHLYTSGGTFNVVLTAMNSNGATSNLTKQVILGNAPTKVNILQIVLTGFPATMPSGGGWDSGSGPDPYYEVSDYPDGATYFKSEFFSDITLSSLPKSFATHTISLSSVDANYQILLKDSDVVGSDYMGGYYLKFKDLIPTDGSAYPTQINIGSSGVTFKLTIEWKQ